MHSSSSPRYGLSHLHFKHLCIVACWFLLALQHHATGTSMPHQGAEIPEKTSHVDEQQLNFSPSRSRRSSGSYPIEQQWPRPKETTDDTKGTNSERPTRTRDVRNENLASGTSGDENKGLRGPPTNHRSGGIPPPRLGSGSKYPPGRPDIPPRNYYRPPPPDYYYDYYGRPVHRGPGMSHARPNSRGGRHHRNKRVPYPNAIESDYNSERSPQKSSDGNATNHVMHEQQFGVFEDIGKSIGNPLPALPFFTPNKDFNFAKGFNPRNMMGLFD